MGAETTDSPTPVNQTPSALRKDNRSDEEKNKLIAFARYAGSSLFVYVVDIFGTGKEDL